MSFTSECYRLGIPSLWGPCKTHIIPNELHKVTSGSRGTLDVLLTVQAARKINCIALIWCERVLFRNKCFSQTCVTVWEKTGCIFNIRNWKRTIPLSSVFLCILANVFFISVEIQRNRSPLMWIYVSWTCGYQILLFLFEDGPVKKIK